MWGVWGAVKRGCGLQDMWDRWAVLDVIDMCDGEKLVDVGGSEMQDMWANVFDQPGN